MKIGVSLYSFHDYANPNSLGVKGCIDKVKEYGGEGVDIIEGPDFPTHAEYVAYAKDIGEYLKKVGIEACCFCAGSDFINGSNGDLDAEIQKTKDKVDVAAAYGCKFMRHDATGGYPSAIKFGRSFDDALLRLVKGYKAVTEYAQTKGVKTCVENHGFFAQDAER
ncbi:MAG: TIM barrel protein, partial [Clostridia bacterium]